MVQLSSFSAALVAFSSCVAISLAGPVDPTIHEHLARRNDLTTPGFGAVPIGMTLKIMPMGDSITWGKGSSDGNGYRLDLRNKLLASNQRVSYVGSQVNGTNNPDAHNEGYPMMQISDIMFNVSQHGILRQRKPNLVLLHAGTNDNVYEKANETYATESVRLGNAIDYLLCTNPDAVILVAKIIQNNAGSNTTEPLNGQNITHAHVAQDTTNIFNFQIPGVVAQRAAQGHKVRLVDMSSIGGFELIDGVHPNDGGYQDMAQRWYTAIREVPALWWPSVMMASEQDNIDISLIDACDAKWIPLAPNMTSTVKTIPTTEPTSALSHVASSSGRRSREVHPLMRVLSRGIFFAVRSLTTW